jgi:hypothetical protein
MTLTRIVGDIHGQFNEYSFYDLEIGRTRHAGDPAPPMRSVQVGDFGIGFAAEYWHGMVNDWMEKNPEHRFIRGNHDDPAQCKKMRNYIADGTVEGDVMYIGGAWSIDHAMRIEGRDWWRDEELSVMEFDRIAKIYEETKPRVMITHDCPTMVALDMFVKEGLGLGPHLIKTRTSEYLQFMFDMHQPELWFFGHWHVTRTKEINGTKFHCLGVHEYVDIDL